MDHPYPDARSTRRPSGTIIVDGNNVADTMQCKHCGTHFMVIAGSGRERGWCMNCGGPTCGTKACYECLPMEKRLGLYEAGKIAEL